LPDKEESKEPTPFDTRCEILSDLWMTYRFSPKFEDFVSYNDIGLPMAFLLSEGLVKTQNQLAKSMIDETFDIFLGSMKLEDTGYESLDDILVDAPEWNG
jgi:hypothetical protein